MASVLVIAPHPDDETLGCGGTLCRHKVEGDELYWGIITGITVDNGWPKNIVKKREVEIQSITRKYGFNEIFQCNLPAKELDIIPLNNIIR